MVFSMLCVIYDEYNKELSPLSVDHLWAARKFLQQQQLFSQVVAERTAAAAAKKKSYYNRCM